MKQKTTYIYLLAFILLAYILLPVLNADYLFTIQDNGIFINGKTFMSDMINHYGGPATWISCYLTQYMYYPWLGSTILVFLWTLIYLSSVWLLNPKGHWAALLLIIPAALLFNILDYGYWIYYAKSPGFIFQPTLLTTLAILAASLLRASLSLAKAKLFFTAKGKQKHAVQEKWTSRTATSVILLIITFALTPLVGQWKLNNHRSSILTTLTDANFHHEMSMYRSLDEMRFEDVLEEYQTCKDTPTNLIVLYKNTALLHTGQMTDMFKTQNIGIKPEGDSLPKLTISRLGASLIYYLHGHTLFAYWRAMENNVQYGQNFRSIKMMARCAIINQEFDLAFKYLIILRSSLFHRKWAEERISYLSNSTALSQSEEYQIVTPLTMAIPTILDNDEGLCQKYLMDTFSTLFVQSPATEDLAICMSLWNLDVYSFCVHFYDYVNSHPDAAIPQLYQEGAILLGTSEESPITLDGFRFDRLISDKFNQFVTEYTHMRSLGIDEQEIGRKLKPSYGSTYWWYYYFCPPINFY